jgi:hypothetical protein
MRSPPYGNQVDPSGRIPNEQTMPGDVATILATRS